MKVIKFEDEDYPKNLRKIYNPPKKIFVMGDEKILNGFGIGIVGTRNASRYGKEITKALSFGLAKKGINIISGMAIGIDTEAHRGALFAKGKTIAVLGSGFKNIYPKENEELFYKILDSGGAIVTEYEEEEKARPCNFPERNRIISGLSEGIVVTEAPKKSGSMITADIALDEGKEVFAVPGNVLSFNSRGTNELIKQGAKLTENIFDILEEYVKTIDIRQIKKYNKRVLS